MPTLISELPELGSSPCQHRVPYHHIGIRVFGNAAFLWVEVEDFCCVAARDGHKSILVHFSNVLKRGQGTEYRLRM